MRPLCFGQGFFPFRDTPFYVSADKAKELLGFEPKYSIADDVAWYFEQNYKAQGGLDKEVDKEGKPSAVMGCATHGMLEICGLSSDSDITTTFF